jgi:hypothetical protein
VCVAPASGEVGPFVLVDLLDVLERTGLGHRTGVFEPARIGGDHRPVGVGEPGKDRQGFDDFTIPPRAGLLGLALLDLSREVVERRDGQPPSGFGSDRPGSHDRPALLAGRPHPKAQNHRIGVFAVEHAAPRQDGGGHRTTRLVEQLEAGERLVGRRRQHLLRRRPAAEFGGRPVDIDDPKLVVDDRHARVDGVENLRQPAGQDSRYRLSIRQMLDQVTPRVNVPAQNGAFQ